MPTVSESRSCAQLGVSTDSPPNQLAAQEKQPASTKKPVIVGLYGVPGSGKTFLLNQLKQELDAEHFAFYEGSEMIASVVPGGLDAFQRLSELEKVRSRQCAIDAVYKNCIDSGQAAVVVGHFMFWSEEEKAGQIVHTQNDLDTFTHILYLEAPAEVIAKRRLDDSIRGRPFVSATHLHRWQLKEMTDLRKLCREHEILFWVVPYSTPFANLLSLLLEFRYHNEGYNLIRAERKLDEALREDQDSLETVLVLDADKTLAAEDTGALFWKQLSDSQQPGDEQHSLTTLFSALGYSYTAFRQATLLCEETSNEQEYDGLCQKVASTVTVYPEFLTLLQRVAKEKHVGAVVLTCGLRCVWEKVLDREGLSSTVKVIGGGRIADGFVITPAVKGGLVARLRDIHQVYVWAFGDSPLDLDMLSHADQAIVVVGEKQTRSTTMDAALTNAINSGGLRARQVVLPGHASPRLDITKLTQIKLTDQEFINSIFGRRTRPAKLHVLQASDKNAAKLLMTPTRDAAAAGPVLREAHRRVGWYLATEYMSELIGLEEYPITHVQSHQTSGYRLFHEQQTSIVALMRGGEAMAFGVSDVFPLAMFVHASHPEDIKVHHLRGQHTVILVDSVVNTGKTVVQFVRKIRNLHATIHIVVVAGVVQAQANSKTGGTLGQSLTGHPNVSLVALRVSENKFTGTGTTDTGNRLFNTTHLP